MTMWGKQILARAIEIQKEIWGSIIKISKKVKYKGMYDVLFKTETFLSRKKCMVTPNFLFGYQEHLLSSAFSE